MAKIKRPKKKTVKKAPVKKVAKKTVIKKSVKDEKKYKKIEVKEIKPKVKPKKVVKEKKKVISKQKPLTKEGFIGGIAKGMVESLVSFLTSFGQINIFRTEETMESKKLPQAVVLYDPKTRSFVRPQDVSPQVYFRSNPYITDKETGETAKVTNNALNTVGEGFTGYKTMVGLFNELLVASPADEISMVFDYGLLENKAHGSILSTTGDGTVTDSGGIAILDSTTGTSKFTTRDRITYKPGKTVMAKFTASFSGAGIGYAGLNDDLDGFLLKYDNGALSVIRRRDGTDMQEVAQGDFNGDDISGIDFTKISIFYVMFGFLGVGNPSIWVLNNDGQPLKIHEFKTIGALTTTHIRHPVLPVQFETSGDMTINVGSINGANLGNGNIVGKQNFTNEHTVTLTGAGTGLLANYRSKESFEYKAGTSTQNKRKARLLQIQFYVAPSTSGTGTIKFTIDQVSSVAGASWSDVDQYGSVMEYDEAGTPTTIKRAITRYASYSTGVGAQADFGGDVSFDADRLGLVAYAGDIFTIRAENLDTGTVDVYVGLNWEEI